MDQNVAKGDDSGQLGNRRCRIRIDTPELCERLADDFELTFNRCAQEIVLLVIFQRLVFGKTRDPSGSDFRVPQQLARISVHIQSDAVLRFDHESTGWSDFSQ